MMKKLFFSIVLAVAGSAYAAEENSCYLVRSDIGSGPAVWQMTSTPRNATTKILDLEIDPVYIKSAAIEYEILHPAYDPVRKNYCKEQNHTWGDIVVKVNEKTVYSGFAGKYITPAGIHHLKIAPEVLKKGQNKIYFAWKKLAKDTQRHYGYIYFAVDKSDREIARRKLPKTKQGKVHNDDIRIRLLLEL